MIRNAAKASLLATNESLDRLAQSVQEVRNEKGKKEATCEYVLKVQCVSNVLFFIWT